MSSSALKLLEGRTLDGRYLLEEWIGGGSFGGVFLAGEYVDDRRLRTVAVKLLPAEPGDAGEAQCRELEVSLNLDHPHLLRCFSAGRCEVEGFDVLYLTMEVAETSLDRVLPTCQLSEAETRSLAFDLCSALVHLHSRHLVHRDVKPGNVLRCGSVWKLADFGCVRALDKSTLQASQSIGTPSYAPPEAGDNLVSPAGDIWSMGCLLLEAATGRLPFESDSYQNLIRLVQTEEPTIAADLPAWLTDMVRACLRKNRSERPMANELLNHLQSAAQQDTTCQERRRSSDTSNFNFSIFDYRALTAIIIIAILAGVWWWKAETGTWPRIAMPTVPTPRATQERLVIRLVPIQNPRKQVREDVEKSLREFYSADIEWLDSVEIPQSAYYAPRQRYRSEKLMAWLHQQFGSDPRSSKIVGVTEKDISTTAHGVDDYGIMGQAYIGGTSCVVSSYRSKRNVGTVALQMIGLTLGLEYCHTPQCLMREGDGTGKEIFNHSGLCSNCKESIKRWLR